MNGQHRRTRKSLALAGYFVMLFVIAFVVVRQCSLPEPESRMRTQIALGTIVEIQVRDMEDADADRAMTAAFAEVRRVDTMFSTYLPSGPVWKLNHAGGVVVTMPEEVHALLRRCDTLWRWSGGAFDIAIEPLVQAWGFSGDNPAIPSAERLQSAIVASGWPNIELLDSGRVRLNGGAAINFGAIAKGYAVDRAVAALKAHGVREGLVNAGGEIRAVGGSWTVGIQHPRDERSLTAVVRLDGRSIATSGDYEQYFERDGRRYHHIFDPSTGIPAVGCRSVSVLAPDNATADALATAAFVMGPRMGIEFLRHLEHIDGMIIDDQGAVHSTPGFDKHISR